MAQWLQVKKSSGTIPDGLRDKPELPEKLEYLWTEYVAIKKGCENITWTALKDYQMVSGSCLNVWESYLMLEIDVLRRNND